MDSLWYGRTGGKLQYTKEMKLGWKRHVFEAL
jgi:hypothetical protein